MGVFDKKDLGEGFVLMTAPNGDTKVLHKSELKEEK